MMRVAFVLRSTDVHPVFAEFGKSVPPSGAPYNAIICTRSSYDVVGFLLGHTAVEF